MTFLKKKPKLMTSLRHSKPGNDVKTCVETKLGDNAEGIRMASPAPAAPPAPPAPSDAAVLKGLISCVEPGVGSDCVDGDSKSEGQKSTGSNLIYGLSPILSRESLSRPEAIT